jgi:transcriptional regulator with XRE-family HTH domain
MTSPFMQRLGVAIRSRRHNAGYSQERFAARIGMHRAYYSAIERGEKNLQIDTLQRVCDGLEIRIWEILQDADLIAADSAAPENEAAGSGLS